MLLAGEARCGCDGGERERAPCVWNAGSNVVTRTASLFGGLTTFKGVAGVRDGERVWLAAVLKEEKHCSCHIGGVAESVAIAVRGEAPGDMLLAFTTGALQAWDLIHATTSSTVFLRGDQARASATIGNHDKSLGLMAESMMQGESTYICNHREDLLPSVFGHNLRLQR
jgi:hypothetical protein